MATWNQLSLTVSNPPRGNGSQDPRSFVAQSMRASFAWGSKPGSASITYIGNVPVTCGAMVRIDLGAHKFFGVCKEDVEVVGSGGQQRTLSFVDLRDFLEWDFVYGCFNKADVRMVNGVRMKRYWHILPPNFDRMVKTYTNTPYTAAQIMSYVMTAPTVGSPWSYDLTGNGVFPAGLMNWYIYDIDCLTGKRLDSLLSEIADKTRLVFTLASTEQFPYRLVWTRKGYGSITSFPPNADNKRLGLALSGNVTNIRVLGERNRYQLLNVPMTPDWTAAWEQFLVVDDLVWDIYTHESNAAGVRFNAYAGDTDHWLGYNDAKVRALELTVRDYCGLREARLAGSGSDWVDNRKMAGRWRMDMPAALYIETVVRRAFRPDLTSFANAFGMTIPMDSAEILDQMLCRVFVDYATGTMTADPSQPVDGNGLLLVKGYQVGEDLFRLAQPNLVNEGFFSASTRGWGSVPFALDDSGEGVRFVVAETPVFASDNLLTSVNGKVVINAGFSLQTPQVAAALVFEAERYSYWKGTYPNTSRDHVENVNGLWAEFVGEPGAYTEIPFSNGEYADGKADTIASALLLQQWQYASGGYELKWTPSQPQSSFGVDLSSVVDRVEITVGPNGVTEVVDFTNERQRDNFEPERELDRRTMQNSYFPGQAELRRQVDSVRQLRAGIRQMQKAGMMPLFQKYLRGEVDGNLKPVWIAGTANTALPAGTPVTSSGGARAKHPSERTGADDTFVGVTVRHNENPAKPFVVKDSGMVLARVKGPVSKGDGIGLPPGAGDYFVKDGTPAVGCVWEAIADGSTKLVQVMIGAGKGGSGGTVQMAKITQLPAGKKDYFVAQLWDGTNLSGSDLNVAKRPQFRPSKASESLLGVTVNYTYSDDNHRTASDSVNPVQNEEVYPPFQVGDVIFITPSSNNTGVVVNEAPVAQLDTTPRVWAKIN